jgi:type IV pilus assembly protein PilO
MITKKSSLDALDPLFEKIGQLSRLHRILISIGVLLLLVGGFVYFSYLPKIQKIDSLEKQKTSLESQLVTVKKKAAQLEQKREEMKKAEENFMLAKAVLPEDKEISSLLESISQSGTDAGLDMVLFQPEKEVVKEFYAEIPVSIKVSGSYHNLATFFDNVSRLYRIVNIQDITIKTGKTDTQLDTSCTAVTYKFVETSVAEPATQQTTSRRTRR